MGSGSDDELGVDNEDFEPPTAAAGAPDHRVLIRVLGPVDAIVDGRKTELGSRLGRMTLATLALSANHMVSLDVVAQVLWGDAPPPTRENTVRAYVSRLRHLLGSDRVTGQDHSYQLNLATDELDALVFETTLSEAAAARREPERCIRSCKQALSLWRGTPFGEFSDRDPFRLEAIRLDELRLVAMELRLESEIALGREQLAVGALESLVEEYPYRERMWFLLITALSLDGRRVEALRACRRVRAVLSEVGLEPTGEIRRLEEKVFAEDPDVRPRLPQVPYSLRHGIA